MSYRSILPEDVIQRMVFDWAETVEYRYPCLRLMYHTPNEGKRSKSEGGKLKRMGLRREQKEYLDALRSEGYFVALCVGHEVAQVVILGYLNGAYKREVSR